ncbi:hypothetical protein FA15DRAFT_662485 [Coprinopsis marcescibilis]|uniref:Uncharacterized protein n=1 Tax=Coprinopsis marcescibilis TaxID=230819 RepID=A0A5C3LCK1_COPMA|nr:hypothetical protein FA15DRAFT_662485 [Coprinopsis marcescibilis]
MPRDYCCCAFPLVNAGIYATLTEQFIISIAVGVLSVATPYVVGVSIPGFGPWILAGACFAVAAAQVLGYLGVAREKPKLYRKYVVFHGLLLLVAFSVAAVWIIMSAARHRNAKDRCISDFFNDTSSPGDQGDTLCTIFPWVDVGIMGGLWVILGAFHIYLFVVVSSYGKLQRQDHNDYDRLYDPTQPLTKDTVPLEERKDTWDSRVSAEGLRAENGVDNVGRHRHNPSTASASDIINEPYQQPSNYQYNYSGYNPYSDEPSYPSYAHTQQAVPTPIAGYYSAANDSTLDRPSQAQPHPAEGQFGRKTPRILES